MSTSRINTAMRLGVAGLGTVGRGVVKLVQDEGPMIAARCGRPLAVTAVSARDRARDRGLDLSGVRWEEDANALAAADDVDVVVELIGGSVGPARDLIERTLAAGKPVVTANKALLALHGGDLAVLAAKHGAPLRFEAAVAGGIPIVKSLREGLVGNRLTRLYGILNGTCNYVLSAMESSQRSFEDILGEAQRLGYAESDPGFDISGTDTAHKLAILAGLGFGMPVDFHALHVEGIGHITLEDIGFAREFGYRIKLLGVAERKAEGVRVRVHPALVALGTPIAEVSGVMNAVMVEAQPVDRTFFEGPGAGAGPTASAVLADIADLARGAGDHPAYLEPGGAPELQPMAHHQGAYYVRLHVIDRPGVMAAISQVLAQADVSIESIIQRGRNPGESVPIVMRTHETQESVMTEALAEIAAINAVSGPPCLIRIEPV